MNSARTSLIVGFIAGTLAGCAQREAETPSTEPVDSAAIVNGTPITVPVLDLYALNRIQKSEAELTAEEREFMLDELIRFRLLADAAESEQLMDNAEVAAELEIQRMQSLARNMAAHYLQENPVTEAELRLAYDENLDTLSGPQYMARHILVETEEEAVAVIAELDSGADFAELAVERSTGPSGPNGGSLGWFTAETMVAPFADAVRAMDVGSHSDTPVQTQFGFHVILLEDKQDQAEPGLDAVRAELTNLVQQGKIETFVNSLRSAATVEVGGEPQNVPVN